MIVDEVFVPTLDKMIVARGSNRTAPDGLKPGDSQSEALAQIRRGWEDLAEADPIGAWETVKGLLESVKR